jgi:bacteriorhodopsin
VYSKIAGITVITWFCYPIVWVFAEGFGNFSVTFEVSRALCLSLSFSLSLFLLAFSWHTRCLTALLHMSMWRGCSWRGNEKSMFGYGVRKWGAESSARVEE